MRSNTMDGPLRQASMARPAERWRLHWRHGETGRERDPQHRIYGPTLSTLQERIDVSGDRVGVEEARIPLDGRAVGADEELLEVPRDVGARHRRPQHDGRAAKSVEL